jgi:CHAD domain-containing protein
MKGSEVACNRAASSPRARSRARRNTGTGASAAPAGEGRAVASSRARFRAASCRCEDPEELHDMRVATRRLRAALKLYSDVLPKRSERYERDLRWVAGALGEVRDLDVHLERLSEESSRNGEDLEEVVALLRERRVGARRRMLEALDSNRYERLVASFSGTLRRGRSPTPIPSWRLHRTSSGTATRRFARPRIR